MSAGLKEMDVVTSENDPCLFTHKDMIAISWIDDLVFVSRDGSKIDEMVLSLKALGYALDKKEGSGLSAFLGIQINRTEGSIELSQPGLIDKVIRYTGMQDCNTGEKTPASVTPLHTDSDGAPWVDANKNWEYAAALRMLMYLANHTRPDIAFAVNQCARFSFGPKQTHAKAIKRILRNLQATRTRGMVFSPIGEIIVDAYADADFAGLWAVEHEQDPLCSKVSNWIPVGASRLSFLMDEQATNGDCPVDNGVGVHCFVSSNARADSSSTSSCRNRECPWYGSVFGMSHAFQAL